MRAQEFLRSLLSVLDSIEGDEQKQPPVVININGTNATQSSAEQPQDDEEPTTSDTGMMVPPLQQEIEMLKKVAGIENAYDDAASAQSTDNMNPSQKMLVMKNISQSPLG